MSSSTLKYSCTRKFLILDIALHGTSECEDLNSSEKHTGCFTNNLYVFYNTIISHDICHEFFFAKITCISFKSTNGIKYML